MKGDLCKRCFGAGDVQVQSDFGIETFRCEECLGVGLERPRLPHVSPVTRARALAIAAMTMAQATGDDEHGEHLGVGA